MRREADHEARRERRARELAAGIAFQQILRERLEAQSVTIEDLESDVGSPGPNEGGERNA
jgi:hypothetical protein